MAEPLTQAELAAIAERAEKASAGPWWRGHDNRFDVRARNVRYPENEPDVVARVSYHDADTDFIASAREDVPRLLATIAERDRDIAQLRAAIHASIVAHKTNVEMVHRLAEQADKLERLIRERGGE